MTRTERILSDRIEELSKLYEIGEAEHAAAMQMIITIKYCGYSPELTTKLLRYITALMEATQDVVDKDNKVENKNQ